MRHKILGNRYKFIVELEQYNKTFYFQILSLYKKEHLKSTITNLNFIISELIFPILNTSDIDTIIFLNEIEGNKIFQKSISAFKNKSWIKALEESLDEDRTSGGWNSNFKI